MCLVARFRPHYKMQTTCYLCLDGPRVGARAYRKLVPIPPAATIGSLGTRRTAKGGAGPPLLFEPSARLSTVGAGNDHARIPSYCSPGVPCEGGVGSGRYAAAPGRDLLLHVAVWVTADLRLRVEFTSAGHRTGEYWSSRSASSASSLLVGLLIFHFHIEDEKPYSANYLQYETFFDVVVNLQVLGCFFVNRLPGHVATVY